MTTFDEKAQEFLAQKRIAVAGVSRETATGNGIYDTLKKKGYDVFAVNPNAAEIDGQPCYPNLQAIPDGVDGVVIVTNPEATNQVVRDAAEAGVTRVWMHYNAMFGEGFTSISDDAVQFCQDNDIEVIAGGCPMMFLEFGHKCMKWILGVTGKLPA